MADTKDPSGFPQSNPPNDGLPKIKSIFDFTAESLEELAVWLEQRGLTTPISQIPGFSQFTAISAPRITTNETTTSTSYTDLATAGPTLTGLSPGQYIIGFGCILATAAGAAGIPLMGLSVNGSTPSDVFAVQGSTTTTGVSGSTWLPQTVTAANTTIQAKYRTTVGTATASFSVRWLIALRYANA